MSKKSRGACWKILSCLCFAGVNGFIKQIQLPVVQLVFLENLFGCLYLSFFLPQLPTFLWKEKAHFFRGLCALPGVLLWVLSLKKLPLYQTVALGFLGPYITAIGAKIFFREKLALGRIAAIFLGALGGLLVAYGPCLTPCLGISENFSMDLDILWPLGTVLSFSASSLLAKHLAFNKNSLNMTFSLMFFLTLFLLPTFKWWIVPSLTDWITVGFIGALITLAHFSMSQSLVCSDITFLIPFGSTRFIASALIGWYFYHEIPTYWALWGVCSILLGLFLLSAFEKKYDHS